MENDLVTIYVYCMLIFIGIIFINYLTADNNDVNCIYDKPDKPIKQTFNNATEFCQNLSVLKLIYVNDFRYLYGDNGNIWCGYESGITFGFSKEDLKKLEVEVK